MLGNGKMIYMSLDKISSTDVGLYVKTHRTVLPELNTNYVEISGRHGFYDYGSKTHV